MGGAWGSRGARSGDGREGDGGRVGGHYLRRGRDPSLWQEGWRDSSRSNCSVEVLLVEL